MTQIRPIPAVIGILIRDGRTLLIRRGTPPNLGLWGFPGGRIEPGETLAAAVEREVLEETGITCRAGRVLDALDAVDPGGQGCPPRAHYVLIALVCDWISGKPRAGDDAAAAEWVPLADLAARSDLIPEVRRLAAAALAGKRRQDPESCA